MSSIKYNVIDSIEMNRLNVILVTDLFKKNSLGTYSLPQGNVSGSKFFVAMAFQHFDQPFTGYYVFYKYIINIIVSLCTNIHFGLTAFLRTSRNSDNRYSE